MSRTTDISDISAETGIAALGDIASQAFNKQLRLLEISEMLARKDDLERLLECFYTESQSLVSFDGLSFMLPNSTERLMFGRKRQSAISLELKKGERNLGVLTAYMSSTSDGRVVSESRDTRELEGLLPSLVYPLEAALDKRLAKFVSWLDDLTGMNNQLALDEVLPREMIFSREAEEPLSLLMIDLDHFQKTAESHGKETAEEILVAVADTLSANLRSTDVIFRHQHDRFVVILGVTDFDDATIVSERLRTCIDRCYAYDNVQLVQSASAGVTEMVDDDTPASLLDRAESALVNAKRAGRNRVRFLAASENG